jgi:hypothetical protein
VAVASGGDSHVDFTITTAATVGYTYVATMQIPVLEGRDFAL